MELIKRWCVAVALLCATVFVGGASVRADVTLPRIFGNVMVLQREMTVPVWGWADPGEKVAVRVDDKEGASAVADEKGQWMVKLPAMSAGGRWKPTLGPDVVHLVSMGQAGRGRLSPMGSFDVECPPYLPPYLLPWRDIVLRGPKAFFFAWAGWGER